jgi:cytochrome c peroxidase
MQTAKNLFAPIPDTPPALKGVQSTPERVEPGKMLYFDPRLSESHAIACNSCHLVGLGGVDLQETSIGHRWQRGPRNAPTLLNAVFNTAQFWDGRAADLEEQAGGPLVNPNTANAPFDRYLEGDETALTEPQKAGLQVFIDKGCVGCHRGINVGGGMYSPFGVVERPGADFLPPTDKGRFEVTKTVSDEYVFKVPSLRNITLTPPHFHTGKS